ncbi:chromosome transmission fidelity protein 18 homolog [Ictidomys tridecemlineatus]|uniref:chromosome transmission fidelity protein 18 homolog isoform X1 n=1 Tax=Ictidomys tridecemlineatus TaxID=43179 RepID=UPI000B543B2A|nr:chromosome transmission fidelity protein 18 homolog isoform X1 [Ictidomys tridecemlineatus]KAG3259252.1 chromosome transmission fidelity factor 18 [Ictidomys tridecemlineatus]
MEDYEEQLHGVEDDFHNQFAAELEVLAELEAATPFPAPSKRQQLTPGRPQLTFEEVIAGGDVAVSPCPAGSPGSRKLSTRKREVDASAGREDPLPPTPKVKRPKLEAVKRLDFGPKREETLLPDSPPRDITPPLSPDVPPELLGAGTPDTGSRQALPGTCNPVLRRPPVLEDFINVTSTSGDRVFLVLHADPTGTGVKSPLLDVQWRGHGQLDLLGVSFSSLKEQVDNERHQRLLEEAQRLSDTLHSLRPEEEEAQPMEVPEQETAGVQDTSQHCLWVDEFAPKHYTELLSDDFTNRCLLKWLKLWDLVVFGHERPARKPRSSVEPARIGKEATAPGKWKSHVQVLEEMLEAELDPSQRPRQKVALLCGPPGLGKTTLAHVIAKHAGYCVVEMNASDDRSPEAFRVRIEAATQMESVLGAGGKPNCLVIDEIDGAPTAAINVLLSIVNRKGPQEAELGAPAVPSGGGRRRRTEGGLLMRPIICICNDQFAPSLRQLKQQAFLLHFPPTLPSRLVQRLQEVSLRQGMRSDPGALAALCEKTDNDIRACINTLQFLHGRGQRELSVRDVQTTHVGLKDQRKGLFSVWQEVFQLPRAQRRLIGQVSTLPAHSLLLSDGDMGSLTLASQRFYHLLRITTSAGEHEKVVQGLFDNFLRLRLRDSSMGAVCTALDWLAFDDLLERAAHHGQSFQLLRYLPFLPAAFHVLFASSHVPRITFPSSQQEAQSRMSQIRNLIQTLVAGIAPATRSQATPQALVLDTLCLLLDILAPRLRPVSTQLYSAREKQQLSSLVGTMLAYSLTYRQERMPDGQYLYRLEPNVEEVCRFPDLPARKPLTYQAKQLIAREIEVEKMRRAEAFAWAGHSSQVDQHPPGPEGLLGCSGGEAVKPFVPCNHKQRLEHIMKRTGLEEQPERDFFGRVIVRRATAPNTEVEASKKDAVEWLMGTAVGRSQVWFRFNEGVSNAVRRSLYIRDLL